MRIGVPQSSFFVLHALLTAAIPIMENPYCSCKLTRFLFFSRALCRLAHLPTQSERSPKHSTPSRPVSYSTLGKHVNDSKLKSFHARASRLRARAFLSTFCMLTVIGSLWIACR